MCSYYASILLFTFDSLLFNDFASKIDRSLLIVKQNGSNGKYLEQNTLLLQWIYGVLGTKILYWDNYHQLVWLRNHLLVTRVLRFSCSWESCRYIILQRILNERKLFMDAATAVTTDYDLNIVLTTDLARLLDHWLGGLVRLLNNCTPSYQHNF